MCTIYLFLSSKTKMLLTAPPLFQRWKYENSANVIFAYSSRARGRLRPRVGEGKFFSTEACFILGKSPPILSRYLSQEFPKEYASHSRWGGNTVRSFQTTPEASSGGMEANCYQTYLFRCDPNLTLICYISSCRRYCFRCCVPFFCP